MRWSNMLQFSTVVHPPIEEQMTKLYRVDGLNPNEPPSGGTGRWFTDSLRDLAAYHRLNPNCSVLELEVPAEIAETLRVSNLPAHHTARRFSARPTEEFFVDSDALLRSVRRVTGDTWV